MFVRPAVVIPPCNCWRHAHVLLNLLNELEEKKVRGFAEQLINFFQRV